MWNKIDGYNELKFPNIKTRKKINFRLREGCLSNLENGIMLLVVKIIRLRASSKDKFRKRKKSSTLRSTKEYKEAVKWQARREEKSLRNRILIDILKELQQIYKEENLIGREEKLL